MPLSHYLIGLDEFKTKQQLIERCREILAATPDGDSVDAQHLPFLFGLFRFHDEWPAKSLGGIRRITTQTTDHGTRCFILQRTDQSTIDLSFTHSIRKIPSTRKQHLLPQSLIDFRNAARTAITARIRSFRDNNLGSNPTCPISGEPLTRDTCAVDHVAPLTFDWLLYNFALSSAINPLHVAVGSRNGTIAVFEDTDIHANWITYHDANAKLRLLSRTGHAQLSTARIDWSTILRSI